MHKSAIIGNTRGQSAVEYLTTYAWGFLAVAIVAAMVVYFGVFNPLSIVDSKTCGSFSQFLCQDFHVDATGAVTVVLASTSGFGVRNAKLLDGDGNQLPGSSCTQDSETVVTCSAPGGSILTGGVIGSQFDQVNVHVSYNTGLSDLQHVDSGMIRGKYE